MKRMKRKSLKGKPKVEASWSWRKNKCEGNGTAYVKRMWLYIILVWTVSCFANSSNCSFFGLSLKFIEFLFDKLFPFLLELTNSMFFSEPNQTGYSTYNFQIVMLKCKCAWGLRNKFFYLKFALQHENQYFLSATSWSLQKLLKIERTIRAGVICFQKSQSKI